MIFHPYIMLSVPVAVGVGWLLGGKKSTHISGKLKYSTRKHYFKGLNYIINEEADKAVDEFVKLIEVDKDTAETHLALGNLFRRRGEVDRAIKIHRNVLDRLDIPVSVRHAANVALIRDYLKAGVLDRAENVCLSLMQVGTATPEVLELLLHVYQKERQWKKAIKIAEKINASIKTKALHIAFFYTELAEDNYKIGQYDHMKRNLLKALDFDEKNLRAHLLLAKINLSKDDFTEAVKCCHKIQDNSVTLLSYVFPLIVEKRETIPSELYAKFMMLINESICQSSFLFFILASVEGFDFNCLESDTFDSLFEKLKDENSLERVHYLLCIQEMNCQGEVKLLSAHLREYLHQLIRRSLVHQCHHCGFKTHLLFWCCPGCDSWGTATKRIFQLQSGEERSQ